MIDAPRQAVVATPLGPFTVTARGDAISSIEFGDAGRKVSAPCDSLLCSFIEELEAYFDGALKSFDTPLAPQGTPFQQSVWAALVEVPYGELRSYADIARAVGSPRAVRAVGAANGANPLPIVIPCHRVVRTGGALGGYAGGLPMKRWLLEHERAHAGASLFVQGVHHRDTESTEEGMTNDQAPMTNDQCRSVMVIGAWSLVIL